MEPGRLARLVSRVHTNLYGIVDQAGLQFGSGLYARAGSLFNHSCLPSAAVSFLGRTWRLHALIPIQRGVEVSVSYGELYAARPQRQAELLEKKGFACACKRCVRPPPADVVLDGWRCVACEGGAVPPDGESCVRCGSVHALSPSSRSAREMPWRHAIDKASSWAHTPAKAGDAVPAASGASPADSAVGHPAGSEGPTESEAAAARHVLKTVERVLKESSGALCETHALRHAARKLRVYALSTLPTRPEKAGEMADALSESVDGMARHMPSAHPELAFFRYRLAECLWQQQAAEGKAASEQHCKALRARARREAETAAAGLAIAIGKDHPTVAQWRLSFS